MINGNIPSVAYILHMLKVTLYLLALLVMPGVIMGTISSYRAGQRPHRDLYLRFKKFTHRKRKR